MPADLIVRLKDAERLGLSICAEARRAIEARDAQIEALEARHADSRSDNLAGAYAALLAEVRSLASDLRYAASDEGRIEDLEAVEARCAKILDTSPAEQIGASLLEDARRAPSLDAECAALALQLLEKAGVGVDELARIGVQAMLRSSGNEPGFSAACLELYAYGRGKKAFESLFHRLCERRQDAA